MTKKYWLVALLAIGIAGCSDDDKEKDTPPESLCGNHQVDKGEVCDGEADLACSRFDDNKDWAADGFAKCSADCKSIEQGSCTLSTPECNNDDDCANKDPNKPKCNQGACVVAPNTKECLNDDVCFAKYGSEKPVCNADGVCEASASAKSCENAEVIDADYKWCQLMGPVDVEIDSVNNSAKLNARVIFGGITNKSRDNDGGLDAELIYSKDVTAKDLASWPHVEAIGVNIDDCVMDGYTATISDSNLSLIQSDKAFFTFRFRKNTNDNSEEWIYCKRNEERLDVDAVNRKILPMSEDSGFVDANAHTVGLVTNLGNIENIIAKFRFDKGTGTQGKTEPYRADIGTGIIQLKPISASCPENVCFGNHESGKAFNVGGFKKEKTSAVKDGAHILISGMNTVNATNINLDMVISRTNANSPDKIVILYSLDGEEYTEAADVSLYPAGTETEKQTGVYYPQSIAFPSDVENAEIFNIKLVPYGNSVNPIRLDDIIISKNNEG